MAQKVTPRKTFLLRQEHEEGKLVKTVVAHAGEPIEVTDEELVKFAGYWVTNDKNGEKTIKAVNDAGKKHPGKRIV
jgi:hypothetical protein